jgi:hypothetical protein
MSTTAADLETTRTVALRLAQGRAILGLVMTLLPGLMARVMLRQSNPATRALVRMLGARDLVLGVGAITNLKEQAQDAEWVSMSAFADGVDTVALALAPGGSVKRTANVAIAGSAAVVGLLCARRIADARPH